jgi:hypothetical protein
VAPHDVELGLSLRNTISNHVVKLEVDFDDDGYIDFTYDGVEYLPDGNLGIHPMDLSQQIAFTFSEAGIYGAKVSILDLDTLNTQGFVMNEHILPVEVVDENQDESLYTAIWDSMNASALAGDIDRAKTAFTNGSLGKFGPLLTALQPYYQEIMDSFTRWQLASSRPGYVGFALNRDIDGQNNIYFVTFIQDHYGVWRILEM